MMTLTIFYEIKFTSKVTFT